MLFVLDKSLADELKEHPDDKKVLQALFYIALGRREGKHLIFTEDPDTMKTFYENEDLDESSRAVYKHIYRNLHSISFYYSTLIRRVRVTAEDGITNISWKIIGNTKEIVIPFHYINDSFIIQKTILLCVNLTDCKIYERMAKVSRLGKGLNIIKYEQRGGGGSTIADEYQLIQEECKSFCLCFSESDQKYPFAPLGGTASRLKSADRHNELLSECIIIEFREIENMIPVAIYDMVNDPNRGQCISFLSKMNQMQWTEAAKYIDIKKGMKGKDYFAGRKDNNPDEWRIFLNFVHNHLSEDCKNEQKCADSDKCQCTITSGMGDKILEAVADFFNIQTPQKTSEMLPDHLKPYWQEYGELVAAWCCAGNRISV